MASISIKQSELCRVQTSASERLGACGRGGTGSAGQAACPARIHESSGMKGTQ